MKLRTALVATIGVLCTILPSHAQPASALKPEASTSTCAPKQNLDPASLQKGTTLLCGFLYTSGTFTTELFDATLLNKYAKTIATQLNKEKRTYTIFGYTDVRCDPQFRDRPQCKPGSTGVTRWNTTLSYNRAQTLETELRRRLTPLQRSRATFNLVANGERYAKAPLWQCASAPDGDACQGDRHADLVLTPTPPSTNCLTKGTCPTDPTPVPEASVTVSSTLYSQQNTTYRIAFAPVSLTCDSGQAAPCGVPTSGPARYGVSGPYLISATLSDFKLTAPSGYRANREYKLLTTPGADATTSNAATMQFYKATKATAPYSYSASASVVLRFDKWTWNGSSKTTTGSYTTTLTPAVTCPPAGCNIAVLGSNTAG